MAEKVVVVGLGLFGMALTKELDKLGYEVLAIDRRADRIKEIANGNVHAVQGDATSSALWEDLQLRDYRVGIVAFSSSIEANILTTLLLRKLNLPHIIAKSNGGQHSEVLRAIGVNVVIQPQEEIGRRVAHVIGSAIEDYIDLADEHGVAKLVAGNTLDSLECGQIEDKLEVSVLVIRHGNHLIINPTSSEPVRADDILIVAGRDAALRHLARLPRQAKEWGSVADSHP
ncbi:MAG: TrkA family potassium uptake protein, partial [Chloroflexi bacterium]|nr:TrkA family potassium uptake protein [Chloroflexota bacterium]